MNSCIFPKNQEQLQDQHQLILDTHHYPISKSEGGEKTVRICPNCYQEFHQLVRTTSYHANKNLIHFFKELAV